jgi:hypothetical protein
MTKRRFLGGNAPNLSKEDMDRLDRRHPERSFTGGIDAAQDVTATAEAPPDGPVTAPTPPTPADDDLVTKLERLRVLRDDGLLTDEEFAAAKARLLGRD